VDESEETLLDKDVVHGRDDDIQDEESFGKGFVSEHKVCEESLLSIRTEPSSPIIFMQRSSPIRYLLLSLTTLLGLGVAIALFSAFSFSDKTRTRGLRHMSMDHVFNGTFYAELKSLNWVPEGMKYGPPDPKIFSHMILSRQLETACFP
jgi:hypothetical protein